MSDKKIIEANIEHVRLRIDRACKRAGRKPADVQLLLATKTVPPRACGYRAGNGLPVARREQGPGVPVESRTPSIVLV